MCICKRRHQRLVGYSSTFKCSWTKAAEPYPRSLARFLAAAIAEDLKPASRRRELDPSSCARCSHRRIGEAAKPGPRQRAHQPDIDLEQVALVQPSTVALQAEIHRLFPNWLQSELSAGAFRSLAATPSLQVMFLRSFGNWWYQQGRPMYLFRHLVVFCQQQFPGERHHTVTAWELLARWESIQPTKHRSTTKGHFGRLHLLELELGVVQICSYHPLSLSWSVQSGRAFEGTQTRSNFAV